MTAAAGAAKPLSPITLNVFPGGFNWPSFAALDKGLFAANGLEVTLQATTNSVAQMTGLANGAFDIAMTAIDNVVAYVEGQGEVPVTGQPDLIAFMGGDNGFLSLVTAPEVKSYGDLKGRTLSVDAMTTGYAFVLLDLLDRAGLKRDDYKVEKAGGVLARWEALRTHKQDGTMLITPFDILAKSAGFNVLQYAIDVYGHYQGLVGAARRAYARDNGPKIEGYIRGFATAVDWLAQPENKADAIAILRKNLPQMSPELAEETYAVLAGPKGFSAKAAIDLEGIKTVLTLRSRYGQPKIELHDPMKYYDGSYYEAAMK